MKQTKRAERDRLKREQKRARNRKKSAKRGVDREIVALAKRQDVAVAARLLDIDPLLYARAFRANDGDHVKAAIEASSYWILDGRDGPNARRASELGVSTRLGF